MEKNEILKKINNLSRELRPQVLLENETFFDNGFDSLDCLDLILLCEKEFNLNFPDEYDIKNLTPNRLVDEIYQMISNPN